MLQMSTAKKISLLLLPLVLMVALAIGQTQAKKKTQLLKKPFIGFYRGAQRLDVSKGLHSKKFAADITSGFVIQMPLVTRFKAEVGMTFSHVLTYPGGKQNKSPFMKGDQSIAIPLTVQYYFLPKESRIQPYIGIGGMLNPNPKNSFTLMDDGNNYRSYPGTQYISILFTQGVTFEVNTKIHLTESLHIFNVGGRAAIGLNFGIGFYLP